MHKATSNGEKRNVVSCKKVSLEVWYMIKESLKENREGTKDRQWDNIEISKNAFGVNLHDDGDDYNQDSTPPPT